MESEENIKKEAIEFVKKKENIKKLIQDFASSENILSYTVPASIFMTRDIIIAKEDIKKGRVYSQDDILAEFVYNI